MNEQEIVQIHLVCPSEFLCWMRSFLPLRRNDEWKSQTPSLCQQDFWEVKLTQTQHLHEVTDKWSNMEMYPIHGPCSPRLTSHSTTRALMDAEVSLKEDNSVFEPSHPSELFYKFSILYSAVVCVPEMLIREQLFVRKGSTGAACIPDSLKHISSLDRHTHTHTNTNTHAHDVKQCLRSVVTSEIMT